MYLYQPCLLALALYFWAFDGADRRTPWLRVLFPLLLLALSELGSTFTYMSFYPAALLLPLPFAAGRARGVAWAEVLAAGLLGAILSWKAADAWPLFDGLVPLCAALLLIPVAVLCRDREDRWLACALGGLFFELLFCLREYTLFSFCVVRLGSREGLSLSAASLCLYALTEQLGRAVLPRLKRAFSIGI